LGGGHLSCVFYLMLSRTITIFSMQRPRHSIGYFQDVVEMHAQETRIIGLATYVRN
jgi:hypothetical protein